MRIELSIAFMKSRIGSISKEIGLISITHVILNMSHFMIYSYKILCSNFCAHFDAIIVVSVKVPCRGMAYQITTIFWFLDDTEKRRIFKNLGHLKGLSEGGKGAIAPSPSPPAILGRVEGATSHLCPCIYYIRGCQKFGIKVY